MESIPDSQPNFASPARWINDLSWRLLGCDAAYAGSLLAAQLWLGLLWFFYQGYGIARGFILCCLLAGLAVLRLFPRPGSSPHPAGTTSLTPLLKALLVATVVLNVGMVVTSSVICLRTSKIPMDEGQTSWRAARLLWRGENPYSAHALVDFSAFRSRTHQRQAAGFQRSLLRNGEASLLKWYDTTLDPHIRDELLPAQTGAAAQREAALYGYKYGPLIVVATAAIAPIGLPAGVLILNGLICFALFAVMWAILRVVTIPQLALAGAAMLALLLDRHITRNYLDRSATDVWALLFGALAVLACLSRRPLASAAAVAFAVGCKSLPGLLFLPLLLRVRPIASVLVFLAVVSAIYFPWLIWDPRGLVFNGILWPLYMSADWTSWQFHAPHWAVLVVRAVIVAALIVLWTRYIRGSEPRLFWTLAVSGTLVLLASGFLRNGYIPWISLWMVTAIAEAFAAVSSGTNSKL
ncbi:MAG TPA: hypothetical protein VHT03_11920 [Rhizomicrobium sp.]|jgi:hypothetical protein|nr:hypothetical protein [Rhizomicrobium sp.]